MIYLHPEFVVRCRHKDCDKTLILDRRSGREEREGKNTWDLIAEYLTLAGWSFSRSQGYVVSETCPEHKTPWIPVPTRGQYDGDERFYARISRQSWAELSRGADLVPYRGHPEARQVYAAPDSFGRWSGDVDEHGFYRDDALPEGFPTCPF